MVKMKWAGWVATLALGLALLHTPEVAGSRLKSQLALSDEKADDTVFAGVDEGEEEEDSIEAASNDAVGAESGRRRRRRADRRRRRRGQKVVEKVVDQLKNGGSARRRRRGVDAAGGGGSVPKADANPSKIEAGWGDMAKREEFFTVFVKGSGFDPQNDRIVAVHGEDKCGDTGARIAKVTGSGEKPSTIAGWSKLPCNAVGASSDKLACGDGETNGVKFPDDKYVDTYAFKVCVCDFSKKGKCSSLADFDVTPGSPTLKVNPVV